MSFPDGPEVQSAFALELFQRNPNVLYSLDATAHLARVSRRAVLIYCCAGLVQPVFQPPYGVMVFTEEAIYRAADRRFAGHTRERHGLGQKHFRAGRMRWNDSAPRSAFFARAEGALQLRLIDRPGAALSGLL